MFERYEYLKCAFACLLVIPRYVKAKVLDEPDEYVTHVCSRTILLLRKQVKLLFIY
jgi:hypothetical protein